MAWDKVAQTFVNWFTKLPVQVALILVIVISWFGAPIGFAVFTANIILPSFHKALADLEERHIIERKQTREEHVNILTTVARSFEQAQDRQERVSDKNMELLERLTVGVEKVTNKVDKTNKDNL